MDTLPAALQQVINRMPTALLESNWELYSNGLDINLRVAAETVQHLKVVCAHHPELYRELVAECKRHPYAKATSFGRIDDRQAELIADVAQAFTEEKLVRAPTSEIIDTVISILLTENMR